jgi:hypothetical protein
MDEYEWPVGLVTGRVRKLEQLVKYLWDAL